MDDAGFEIEHGHEEYTDAELLEQAQANAQAIILATLAFLEARGIAPADWAAHVGGDLEPGWGEPRPWDAGEFLDAMLTNYRSLGATVAATELGPNRATATLGGFPAQRLVELIGVAPATAAAFHGIAARIANARGLSWSTTVDGPWTLISVERTEA